MPNARLCGTAFKGYLSCWDITTDTPTDDIYTLFEECLPQATNILNHELTKLRGIKCWICIRVTYRRGTDATQTMPMYHCANTTTILNDTQLAEALLHAKAKLKNHIDEFQNRGSDWVVSRIEAMEVHVARYRPLRASSFRKLPPYIARKEAIVNPQNRDQKCFMWAVLIGIHDFKQDAGRVSKYRKFVNPKYPELTFEGIEFPVSTDDIDTFEEQNGISVNVFTSDIGDQSIYPIHRTKKRQPKHVNLFLYDEHYSCIRNLDRLLGDQTRHKSKGYYCDMCLYPFFDEHRLLKHQKRCDIQDLAQICTPQLGENILKFKNMQKMLRQPMVGYLDIESLLLAIEDDEPQDASTSYTQRYQKHEPCSYGMVLAKSCCGKSTYEGLKIETCKNPIKPLLENLVDIAENQLPENQRKPLTMSQADNRQFTLEKECNVCKKPLGRDKVRDHCHICGRYRQALHSACNQQLRLSKELPVVIHNLRRYDSHLIMQSIGEVCVEKKLRITCIAKGTEDYISFTVHGPGKDNWRIKFIDSLQFLQAPLEKLADALPFEDARALRQYFGDEVAKLLKRKGVLPYDAIDSWETLYNAGIMKREEFFNKLNGVGITEEDYEFYLYISKKLGIKTLREYLELYLKTDVLLLADVFEQFRDVSMESFGLDPCNYCTLPGLGWDACLKLTGVKLELLTDPDMYTFLESGMRGGISMISQRHSTANNPYLDEYNSEETSKYIMYLDANNLYGGAMMEPLPVRGFKFLSEEEINNLDVSKIDRKGLKGYIFECDLDYPEHLHDDHNCYPLAPEKMEITEEMISPYCKNILSDNKTKHTATTKLVPNLHDKKNYIVHHQNLLLYLRLGMKVRKVHRVLEFEQDAWMVPYVEYNTTKRKAATNELTKNHHKLLVNSVFGRGMENVRNYVTCELVTDPQRFLKLVKKPSFERATIFNCNLVACIIKRDKILLNKPIYTGFSVLGISKTVMYEFHYDYIRQKYGENARLLMTDTDSLMYEIETADIYKDMYDDIELFDTSEYPPEHFLYNTKNKKVLLKMKDELAGKPANEFVGLRPKMYSIRSGRIEKKRAKGIKKQVVKDIISHTDYRDTLRNRAYMSHKMNLIRSFDHELYSVTLNKRSLGAYDDKRYIYDDNGVYSWAYGHYRIRG